MGKGGSRLIYSFYGQPGAGKTTLSIQFANAIGTPFLIDGDRFREMMKNRRFSNKGREDNLRNANAVATYLNLRTPVSVVLAFVNPFHRIREELKDLNGGQVIEILLKSERTIRRLHHVASFEAGAPDITLTTDRPIEETFAELNAQLETMKGRR
jgi:adenylylsulfate kinase-like enzyme